MASEEIEMEGDEPAAARIPFQLQFDKPIPFEVKMAEWNPEKDLLAMVTDDSKVLLHRFNWQRLWTVSPGKCVTSLCWRPDGKALALGLEDGSISLLDVENGKLVRSVKSHNAAVVCLNWEEDAHLEDDRNIFTYEDRTLRFFPLPPRIPRPAGLGSGDNGLMEEIDDSFQQLSNSSLQRFNILCSGDKDGCICLSIFGIFPIGKINIHELSISTPFLDEQSTYQLQNVSIHKVALVKNLCKLIVLTLGELVEEGVKSEGKSIGKQGGEVEQDESGCVSDSPTGLHCMLLNTSIFLNRKNEFHQVAQQASSIEDSLEVIRVSLSLMPKQWSDAMHSFHEKFDPLASLIVDHGLESSPQEEFISLLCGARTSPPLHQFLVNSLGEVGLKRVCKAVDGAGKELQLIIREHLQPAVEIIVFRIGELRGLSRWHARYKNIGLDETLIDHATEKTGMLLVQVERLLRVLTIVIYLFQNFFTWILKCIKTLMSEPVDEIQPFNSELVIIFLKFLLDHDPVGQLLEHSEVHNSIDVDLDTMQRIEELVAFGGFLDTKFLERNLAKEFNQLEQCFKEAFLMPFTTVSKKILCEDLLPMYPVASSPSFLLSHAPTSIAYYKGNDDSASDCLASKDSFVDYMCFRVPDESLGVSNSIVIVRGFINDASSDQNVANNLEAVILCVPDEYRCVDLSLYKENQVLLLLNEATSNTENPERSLMMMVQPSELSFVSVPRSPGENFWKLRELKALAVNLCPGNGKVRHISHSARAPLAVSASRGVACAFATRRHAMVYILDEDEDEVSDME